MLNICRLKFFNQIIEAVSVKNWIPQTLFSRTALIVLIPLVILQLVTSYVFFDRHWDSVTKTLASNIAGEVSIVSELMFQGHPFAWRWARGYAYLDGKFIPNAKIPAESVNNGWIDEYLKEALQKTLPYPYHLSSTSDMLFIKVQLPTGVLDLHISRKRLSSKTTMIFIMWTLGTTILVFIIAILFLRNQIRPIARLAIAAENFGKGRITEDFKPGGAYEVRKAGIAFSIMQERIRKHLKERMDMLNAISHDLRTPLTRMKLQLALDQKGKNASENVSLEQDIQEMEKMIEGYLAFARGEQEEPPLQVDIGSLLKEVVEGFTRHGSLIEMHIQPYLQASVRLNAMRRCLTNLIENAVRYASHAWISVKQVDKAIEMIIEDDGPGIPANKYEEVFRPFYRLDLSRNPDTGGVGLGLSIAKDIIRGHGGEIELTKSESYGGLKIIIKVPM